MRGPSSVSPVDQFLLAELLITRPEAAHMVRDVLSRNNTMMGFTVARLSFLSSTVCCCSSA